jgi:hypothetical protein
MRSIRLGLTTNFNNALMNYLTHDQFTKNLKKEDEERGRWFLWIKKTILRIRDGRKNPIYLIRFSLLTLPWLSVKLHRIYLSDDDCMHDHPWSFVSFVLWGGYIEQTPDGKKLYGPGSILWRKAPAIHRLEVFQPATTLVITFRKHRDWGFYTPRGWVFWKDYIRSGQKCD